MKIGAVVNLKIHERNNSNLYGEFYKERHTTCIVITRKLYHDLSKIWLATFPYLVEFVGSDGLYIATCPSCPPDLQGFERHNPLCYELMYGDNRVWIRKDILVKHLKET